VSFAGQELAVAVSGRRWALGDVTVHQSEAPGCLLYAAAAPRLATDPDSGRHRYALTVVRSGPRLVRGAVLLAATIAPPVDAAGVHERWLAAGLDSVEARPRFAPLPLREVRARLLVGRGAGNVLQPPGGADGDGVAVAGDTVAFLVELDGATELWADALRARGIPAGVRFSYRYPCGGAWPRVSLRADLAGPLAGLDERHRVDIED
jgi:hypothetical protein